MGTQAWIIKKKGKANKSGSSRSFEATLKIIFSRLNNENPGWGYNSRFRGPRLRQSFALQTNPFTRVDLQQTTLNKIKNERFERPV